MCAFLAPVRAASGRSEKLRDEAIRTVEGVAQLRPIGLRQSVPVRAGAAQVRFESLRQGGDVPGSDYAGRSQQQMKKVGCGLPVEALRPFRVEARLNLLGLPYEHSQQFGLEPLVAERLPGQVDEVDGPFPRPRTTFGARNIACCPNTRARVGR